MKNHIVKVKNPNHTSNEHVVNLNALMPTLKESLSDVVEQFHEPTPSEQGATFKADLVSGKTFCCNYDYDGFHVLMNQQHWTLNTDQLSELLNSVS